VKLIAGGNSGNVASIILQEAADMSRKLGHLSRCHNLRRVEANDPESIVSKV
jgi:hypothetical protein